MRYLARPRNRRELRQQKATWNWLVRQGCQPVYVSEEPGRYHVRLGSFMFSIKVGDNRLVWAEKNSIISA